MRTRPPLLALLIACLLLTGCTFIADTTGAEPPEVADDDDFGTVEIYRVGADAMLEPAASGAAGRIWETFVAIVTVPVAGAQFSAYMVGDAPDSDTLAYVTRDEDDPSLWTLAANAAFADDEDSLLQTLVHEYAHVLSLNVEQVPDTDQSCSTLALSEGCAAANAYLYAFQQEFWDAYPDAPSPQNEDDSASEAFYDAHEDDFVSAYAATNVTEDFAESFAAFVREDEPASDSPVAQKLLFFWAVPEFVDFRSHVRETFGLI